MVQIYLRESYNLYCEIELRTDLLLNFFCNRIVLLILQVICKVHDMLRSTSHFAANDWGLLWWHGYVRTSLAKRNAKNASNKEAYIITFHFKKWPTNWWNPSHFMNKSNPKRLIQLGYGMREYTGNCPIWQ